MKITYFLVDRDAIREESDRPVLTMKRVSIYELSSDAHPNIMKGHYQSLFLDIQIEEKSKLRENNEILFLADVLEMDISILEEIITDQRPRLESYSGFLFALYKSINRDMDDPYTKKEYQVGLKILGNLVICIHFDEPVSMDTLYRYFDRNQKFLLEGGSTYLFTTYLDCLTDPVFQVLREWRSLIKKLEVSILQTPKRQFLSNISDLKESLMDLDYILRADKEVVSKIYALKDIMGKSYIPPELDDHIIHCLDESRILTKILSMLMEIYYSIDSIQLNISLARLTIVTAMFLLPTLIADIFGMNNPGFPNFSFYYAVIVILISMVLAYMYFRRKLKIH